MFFIGGLNSIMPYIIYLSIIWVFLIVSFCGKISQSGQLFAPVSYCADNHALPYYDSKVFHYYQHSAVRQTLTIQKDQTVIPWSYFYPLIIKNDPGGYEIAQSFDFHYYSFFDFRGPPAANQFI